MKSIEGFHILSLLQLAVTMAAFIAVLSDELSLAASAAVTMFAVSMPAVVTSFGCLIATERNVVLLTACLFYCVRRYESTGLKCYAVGAVLAAQYMLYCKEIVFLMLFGFAAARIVLRWWIKPSGGIQLGHPDNRLDLLFAAQSLAFLVFYAFMMFPHSEAAYIERNQMSAVQLIRHYLVLVPGALPFLVFCCVRFFQIVRARVVPDPDWDAFAFAGLVYLAALWVLRFGGWYYSAPVDVVGVVCMGRLLCLWWPRASLSPVRRIAAALVVLFLAEQGLAIGIRNILDRKTMIHRKSRIAGLIADRMRREAGATAIDVHVPLSNGYVMSEFASYLSYRGLPLEEDPPAILPGGQQPRIRIFLGQFTKDARCFWARPFVCRAGAPAAPALTIVLPEDNWQSGQPAAYAAFERQMLEADPGIAPPVWMTRVLEWCWSLDFE